MTAIPTAAFRLTASGGQAVSELRKTKGELDTLSAATSKVRAGFAALGVSLSVSAVVNFARGAIQAADALDKAGRRAGVAGEAISELAFAAKQSGGSLEGLSTALRTMQKGLSEAAQDTGQARTALAALGVSLAEVQALAPDRQFELLGDRISQLESPSDRARAAILLFGEAGANLLPLFDQGAEGIRKLREEAQQVGQSFSTQQLSGLAAASDSVSALGAAWEAFSITLVSQVAPAITNVLNRLAGIQPTAVQALDAQIERAKAAIQTFNVATQAEFALPGSERARELNAELDRLTATYDALIQQRAKLAALSITPASLSGRPSLPGFAPNPGTATQQGPAVDQIGIDGFLAGEFEKARAREEAWAQFDAEFISRRKEAQILAGQQQLEAVIAAEQAIYNARASAANLAVGLLQSFAGKSKAAAVAAIVLGKGLAIAQTIQSTSAAVMRAYAELGPIAGPPAAAKIALLGKVQVGLIAATGLGQIASLGSGGASIGTPANPVFTQNNGDQPQAGASGQNVLQVVFAGPVFNTADTRRFIAEAIREETDRDVIIINQRSAQAQALQGA